MIRLATKAISLEVDLRPLFRFILMMVVLLR